MAKSQEIPEQVESTTLPISTSRTTLVFLGVAAMTMAPVAACGPDRQGPNPLVQGLPPCEGFSGDAQHHTMPDGRVVTFNMSTGMPEGQQPPSENFTKLAAGALALVTNQNDYSAGTGVLVENGGVRAVLTAGHVTLVLPEAAEGEPLAENIARNSIRLPGQPSVFAGWGCSPHETVGTGPDVAVVFTYNGLEYQVAEPFSVKFDEDCPTGPVDIATLQDKRQPGDPAVYSGYMTPIENGMCGVLTGYNGSIAPGASGGAVVRNGSVIATIGGAVNPDGSTRGVSTWTRAELERAGIHVQGGPEDEYAVAWVVTGEDLGRAFDAAVATRPEHMKYEQTTS